jgi:thiol-disulfide isomerase/thioredoxin
MLMLLRTPTGLSLSLLWVVISWLSLTTAAFGQVPYKIKGEFAQVQKDSIGLYEFYATELYPLQMVPIQKNGTTGTFTFEGKAPCPGVYFMGWYKPGNEQTGQQAEQFGLQVLIGEDKEINIKANAESFPTMVNSTVITDAPSNQKFDFFWKRSLELQILINRTQQEAQQYAQDPNMMQAKRRASDSLFNLQTQFHAQYIGTNDLLGRIAKIYYYLPFGSGNTAQEYPNAEEYFMRTFIHANNYNDPAIGSLPIYFQKVSYFVNSLMTNYQFGLAKVMASVEPLLKQMPARSKTKELFIYACMVGAAQSQQSNQEAIDTYVSFAKLYLEDFPKGRKSPECSENVKRFGGTLIGSAPPDIDLSSPDGKNIKLSSLKGKVVLIDFWASWCGPCRRENPHVVKVYEKYKAKGFEVYSVSLDKDANAWKDAIQKDQLIWPSHVSDLQGWQSGAAKLYNVSAIPKTFLLDKSGKIVGKDLRGEQLEKKLVEIFGS